MISRADWAGRVAQARDAMPPEPLLSRWFDVEQQSIALHAHSVQDSDPVHIDPAWARANTPFGGTIAAGLWVAALLVPMLRDSGLPDRIEPILGVGFGLNYGFDRLRFTAPTPSGARIRGHFTSLGLDLNESDTAILRLEVRAEIEAHDRPALAGLWLLAYTPPMQAGTEP